MQSNPIKVLVAEDHEDTRELFVLVLEQCHYEVMTATSVRDALELAKSQRFDLFVLDSLLTDGSGLDLCTTIRKTDGVTPILFCSALAYEKDKQEALKAGAQDYLVKPVNFSGLCERIEQLIEGSSSSKSPLVRSAATRKDSGDLPATNVSV